MAKKLKLEVNIISLGYLTHREDNSPLLRVLTQNFLKLNVGANRSPKSLFMLPTGMAVLMSRVEEACKLFCKAWNEDCIPLIANRQKLHDANEDLV